MSKTKLNVNEIEIVLYTQNEEEYISITDMAKFRDAERTNYIIQNWMRTRNTIEFIGLWEQLHNPNFKSIEYDAFRNESGLNSFSLTPKRWIETTGAIGINSKSGRYGGTYAHKDIAFEFASQLSPTFKLYFIKEFQRLKEEENKTKSLEWNLQRTLTKINYRIHTDAIKEKLVPPELTKAQITFVYANEADMLNVAMFGKTAQQWQVENPDKKGNMRDYATIEQLVILTNMESINALLIRNELSQQERLIHLNEVARTQMKSLLANPLMKKMK